MLSHAALTGVRKHQERYVGLYVVGAMIHPNAYHLKGLPPGVPQTQNVQFLRPFRTNPERFASRPSPGYANPVEHDRGLEWEVERILAHRSSRNRMWYRIQWKDTPQTQWLPDRELVNCRELVREYHATCGLPAPE